MADLPLLRGLDSVRENVDDVDVSSGLPWDPGRRVDTRTDACSPENGGSSSIEDHEVVLPPDSDASHWNMNYQEAAIYLQEGENNDKFFSHPRTCAALPAYLLVHNTWFYLVELAAALLLMALSLCESPAVPYFELSIPVHGALEISGLLLVALELALKMRWLGPRTFLRHRRTMLISMVLVVQLVEAIVLLVRQTSHVRVTRALRPIFLVDTRYCGVLRRNLRQILQSLPPILDMMVLLLYFMLIFALLGFYLFSDNEQDPYFTNLESSLVSLFILLTTANFPDVMLPSYASSHWACLFFIVYLSIELYFIMNLLLAVVFDSFNEVEKLKFKSLLLHKRAATEHAHRLLLARSSPQGVSLRHFMGLMHFFRPRRFEQDVLLAFKALNVSQTGFLSLEEFHSFYEVCKLKWKRKNCTDHWFDNQHRTTYLIFRGMNLLVKLKAFKYLVYLVILTNGVWILVDAFEATGPAGDACAPWFPIAFVAFYCVEAVLKIVGLGPTCYFTSGWNVFDFLVTLSALLGLSVCLLDVRSFYFIVTLRPLRLLRIFKVKKRFREVLGTMFELFPRMASLALTLMVFYYSFGIVGMEFFAGVLYPGCCNESSVAAYFNPVVRPGPKNGTEMGGGLFFLHNFDNILNSFVTLFGLTVVNNWYITMEGVVSQTSRWSRLYFMIFYLVTMVVLTIIVAFILEAFLFRMNYNRLNTSVDNDEGIVVEGCLTEGEIMQLDCHGTSLPHSSINEDNDGVILFRGQRNRTKSDLSIKMYKNEIQEWYSDYSRLQLLHGGPNTPHMTSGPVTG
uniref:two pore channel protein 1 n=1 Tax=Myxine glutinosa TaxID=7769 RepID=UPI00358DF891